MSNDEVVSVVAWVALMAEWRGNGADDVWREWLVAWVAAAKCLGAECHECRMRADVPECAVSMRYA